MSIRLKLDPKPICAILLAGTTLLIAACGASSSTAGTTVASSGDPRAAANPTVSSYSKAHHDVVSSAAVKHRPRHGTGGAEVNDDNPGQADAGSRPTVGQDPCKLVPQAQAQAIIGKPIGKPTEAPLGPTCIYRPVGADSLITMTVESTNFAGIRAHIRHRTQLDVSGRPAYCGTYGQPTVFVPLASGRVLEITAPCAIGTRFAATALPRLGA
jgi:hypothetical protein